MKKYVKRKIFVELLCHPENNIFEFNQYIKLGKMQYIIHADVESLIEKIDNCKNNPEKIFSNKNRKNIFLVHIQCEQFVHLVKEKISIVCIVEKII